MVRRHVTATLSIVKSDGLEHVFSTSFLHCYTYSDIPGHQTELYN